MQEAELDVDALPYERFERFGAGALTDAELLAIMIRTGSGTHTPMEIGQKILALDGGNGRGLNSLYHLSVEDLMQIDGIGRIKAVKLKCIAELSRRMAADGAKQELSFHNPKSVADYYMELLRHEEQERVILVALNQKLCKIDETVLSIGTCNASLLEVRDVFLYAFSKKAVWLVLLHNHPGGNPSPSEADLEVTAKVKEAGEITGIRLVDHIIIGNKCYLSFKEKNLL